MRIAISEYSPLWPRMFDDEADKLARQLPDSAIIEHIGSTSVPGLAAKPVIDILVGLADFKQANALVQGIVDLGYEYVPEYEAEMPFRRFFRKENGGVRTHHIHMVGIGTDFWNRHLLFRDYLRTHPDTAAQYAALKLALAARDWPDMNAYVDAKTDFIRRVEAEAMQGEAAKGETPGCDRRFFLQTAAAGMTAWTIGARARAQTGAVPTQPRPAAAKPVPMTGIGHAQLVLYDELMQSFMQEHKPPGAALAVAKAGRLVYARGFGHADRERNEPVEPVSLFRIASLSKSLTSAAIFRLIESGRLKLEAKVFELLRLTPHLEPGRKVDPRLREVTVLQCVQHTAGWDRDKGFDPMSADAAEQVAKALKVNLPIRPEQIIRYTFGQPLNFAPGSAYAYSNFGYCVLGRVIEAASGQRYDEYVRKEIFDPLGIRRMRLGKNLLVDRAPGEVKYYDSANRTGRAISGPRIGQQAPLPYGVECVETMDANGGWIASAVDLLRFTSSLDDPAKCRVLSEKSIRTILARPDGRPGREANGKLASAYYGCGWEVRPVNEQRGKWTKWHTGGLAGSSTLMVCRNDDIDWVVLFNSDGTRDGKAFADTIDPLLHGPADKIKDWPNVDLFDKLLPKRG